MEDASALMTPSYPNKKKYECYLESGFVDADFNMGAIVGCHWLQLQWQISDWHYYRYPAYRWI